MTWFNKLNITGLWNGGSPVPVSDAEPLPVIANLRDGAGVLRPHKGGADGSALVTDALGYYFSRGELRHVGASITSGLASTQSFRLGQLASSAKHILLLRAYIASSVAATFTLNKDGTLTAPTSHTPWNPNYAFGSGTVAQAQTLVGSVTGGTPLASAIRCAVDITLPFDLGVLLPAGVGAAQSLCMSATFSVGSTSFVNVVYAEVAP